LYFIFFVIIILLKVFKADFLIFLEAGGIKGLPHDDTLLYVQELKAYYKTPNGLVKAVDNVSFTVRRNEIFGIAGESGCGKSTLAMAILRLLKPPGFINGGKVLFKGKNLLKLSPKELREIRWKSLSYIPQSSMNALNPVLRIKDQFIDMFKEHGIKKEEKEYEEMIKELLINVGLAPEVMNMYPHELSGGMRQRTIIAMAIALRPELIIADEPTTALDVVIQRGIIQLLSEIRRKYNVAIILITHDMAVHAELADRIGIMYAGKIVEIGSTYEIFKKPLHPYTDALINSIPILGVKKTLKGIKGLPPDLKNPPPGCRFHPRCPMAMEICKLQEPPLISINNRKVACFLYR